MKIQKVTGYGIIYLIKGDKELTEKYRLIQKMYSISYVYISWTISDMWMIYIKFEAESLKFLNTPLERSLSEELCSSVSWEQNGYYAAQQFLRVSEENVRRIQESFELSPRRSTRRASRELGIPQPTLWRVLRRSLLFNWVHLFKSLCII